MKNAISCVDLPKGESKTKENVLSFKSNGGKVILSNRTEERTYNGCVIVEKDKTRISTEKNGIRIVKINAVIENGVEKKVVELTEARKIKNEVVVKRRKRVVRQREILDDFELCVHRDKNYFYNLRSETLKMTCAAEKRIKIAGN